MCWWHFIFFETTEADSVTERGRRAKTFGKNIVSNVRIEKPWVHYSSLILRCVHSPLRVLIKTGGYAQKNVLTESQNYLQLCKLEKGFFPSFDIFRWLISELEGENWEGWSIQLKIKKELNRELSLPMAQDLEEDHPGHQLRNTLAVEIIWILTPFSAQYSRSPKSHKCPSWWLLGLSLLFFNSIAWWPCELRLSYLRE